MRGAIGGILTIKRADREDNASSASNDDGETWHTQSAEKMEILFEFSRLNYVVDTAYAYRTVTKLQGKLWQKKQH